MGDLPPSRVALLSSKRLNAINYYFFSASLQLYLYVASLLRSYLGKPMLSASIPFKSFALGMAAAAQTFWQMSKVIARVPTACPCMSET